MLNDIITEHKERMLNLKKYYPFFKLMDVSFAQFQEGRYEMLDMGYIVMGILRFFIEENNFKEKDVTYPEYLDFITSLLKRHFERGLAGLRLDVHGDAAAVIADADDVAGLDGELDVAAVASEGLVDGVVDDLIHQVVQAGRRCRADVHARTFAHGLQTLEDLDLAGVVLLCDFICNIWHGLLPSVQRRGQRFSSPLALLRLYSVAVLSCDR